LSVVEVYAFKSQFVEVFCSLRIQGKNAAIKVYQDDGFGGIQDRFGRINTPLLHTCICINRVTENYWQNELRSLGIESKRKNKLNDKEELHALADSIEQVYYQDYKTAYNEEDDEEKVKASDFDHII
jgi:hypothetical protein